MIDSFRYEYVLRDHLGNGRVYFSDLNEDSKIQVGGMDNEVMQENHYYPFGLNQEGPFYPQQPITNQYQYNGKELNEEFGLNWNDYGARFYDPAIGRWTAVDPLAEKMTRHSPYNYGFDNPIRFIDSDGMAPEEYPIVRITKQKTGKTAEQRVLGYSGGATTQVDLYKVVVTDTEDSNFKMEFSITRDAWTVEKGNSTASNVAFEPKDGNIYTERDKKVISK